MRWHGAAMALLALALVACDPQRRACRKADRLVTRAVVLCPEKLRMDTTTATVVVPADTSTGTVQWSDAEAVDSLLAVITQLQEALVEERRLMELMEREHAGTLPRPPPTTRGDEARERARSMLCTIAPVMEEDEEMSVHIWWDAAAGRIRYAVECKQRVVEVERPCPPSVVLEPGERKPAIGVLMWVVMWLLLVVALWYVLSSMFGIYRRNRKVK